MAFLLPGGIEVAHFIPCDQSDAASHCPNALPIATGRDSEHVGLYLADTDRDMESAPNAVEQDEEYQCVGSDEERSRSECD